MAAADQAAIDGGTPSLELMERAGRAVGRASLELAGGAYGRRVVIVCRKGNNAGDGFVAARFVQSRGAFPVVILLEDAGRISGDAAVNLARLRGVRVLDFDPDLLNRELRRASVIVDAIFGTGFHGRLEGVPARAVKTINASQAPVVAVDIPSGVNGTTGKVEGAAVFADLTVTMGALKVGLILYPGSKHAGEVRLADIGVNEDLIRSQLWLVTEEDVSGAVPAPDPTAHKTSVGTAIVIAGSVGMSGAATLAAKGALRAGAGLVTVAAPASVALEIDQTVLEATTLPLAETGRGTIETSAIDAVLERAESVDAVALGPGLSRDAETVEFVHKLVGELSKPLVLDADGINAFAGNPAALTARKAPTLLTPHPGELGRLLGKTTQDIDADRIGAAREAAVFTGAVVLLKGYRTVVASPSGEATLISTGGPALATGGAGDVLTGISVALLAGGLDPFTAGWCAAWIHGKCGDVLSRQKGDRATVAGDIIEVLPLVMMGLENGL